MGLGHITKYQINLDLIEMIQFCLNIDDLLDILDIFLHILLKPPQPLMGLFFLFIRHDNLTHSCILSGSQLKSSGEQLKSHDLFLDTDKLQLHLAVSS